MRTTYEEVKAILDNTELTKNQIEAYIVSSNIMVTEVMGTSETSDILKEIERWLTAHMIASTKERQEIKAEAGGAAITYSDIFKRGGLASTTYGQTVLALDTTGAFANLALKPAYIHAVKSFD